MTLLSFMIQAQDYLIIQDCYNGMYHKEELFEGTSEKLNRTYFNFKKPPFVMLKCIIQKHLRLNLSPFVNGARTLSTMTPSMTTFSMMTFSINKQKCDVQHNNP
jgi:hypothetical protein